jgi:hypothetical protein
MENSKIQWCDHTFNPWIGCQHVSPGCDRCYAETLMDHRYGKVQWGPHGKRKRTSEGYWKQPFSWAKAARESGTRPRVFCASLADVFDNQVPQEWRDDLFRLIRATPELDWLLLTKRPQNIIKCCRPIGAMAIPTSGSASPLRTPSTTACAGRSSRAFRPLFALSVMSPQLRRSGQSTSTRPIACQTGSSVVASLAAVHAG